MKRRRQRPRLVEPERMEHVLDRTGEARPPPIPVLVWRRLVGPRIADRARPVSLEGRTLLLRVASSTWSSELSLLAPGIVSRLRDAGFDVMELRFRVGQVDPAARPPERRTSRAVPRPAALPAELASAISRIPDDGLKEAVALAARANLAWQMQVHPAEPVRNESKPARRK